MVSVRWWIDPGDSGSLMPTCFFARPSNASTGIDVKWPRLNKLFLWGLRSCRSTAGAKSNHSDRSFADIFSPSDYHGCHKHKPKRKVDLSRIQKL